MNSEWGTPISKDKIIARRNRLIEYQKVSDVRFTPLYDAIDENILDINYMIYEIDRLNKIIKEALYYLEIDMIGTAIDKLQELKKEGKE